MAFEKYVVMALTPTHTVLVNVDTGLYFDYSPTEGTPGDLGLTRLRNTGGVLQAFNDPAGAWFLRAKALATTV